MLSDSDSETPMLYVMQSDDLPLASENTDLKNDEGGDDTSSAKDPKDIAMKVMPPEESSPIQRRSARRWHSPPP